MLQIIRNKDTFTKRNKNAQTEYPFFTTESWRENLWKDVLYERMSSTKKIMKEKHFENIIWFLCSPIKKISSKILSMWETHIESSIHDSPFHEKIIQNTAHWLIWPSKPAPHVTYSTAQEQTVGACLDWHGHKSTMQSITLNE